jgi:hypothetical protein
VSLDDWLDKADDLVGPDMRAPAPPPAVGTLLRHVEDTDAGGRRIVVLYDRQGARCGQLNESPSDRSLCFRARLGAIWSTAMVAELAALMAHLGAKR